MDKFGYIRGRRGPRGPPGKNAFELQSWCPTGVLDMFRREEEFTFFFNTEKDGLLYKENKVIGLKDRFGEKNAICLQNLLFFNTEKDGLLYKDNKVIGLKDRFGEKNAICLQKFCKPMKIGKYYGIPLNDTLYKISDIETATTPPSLCIIALQFKVSGALTEDKDGYIICNETLTRGVKINKSNLNILGTDPMELVYDYRGGWNTLIIQYSNIVGGDGKCFFILNDEERGTFVAHECKEDSNELYIGGKKEKEGFARVVLTNLEMYLMSPLPDPYLLPESILNLIQNYMSDRTPYPPPPIS